MGEILTNPTAWLLALALLAAPVTVVAGSMRASNAAPIGTGLAALSLLAALWGWLGDPEPIDLPWVPEWNLRLTFELDGLAALYALLATGIGLAAVAYAGAYIPLHLHHEHRPPEEATRLYALLLLFMGAMVGLVLAQDLILIFIFWDVTAITSYFLIGYDRHKVEARSAALMAMLVTGVSAVLLLIGFLMLYAEHGTTALPQLIERATPGDYLLGTGSLMLVGALAKSAQVPLHFWLPRAMAAPTPVSAYLHSAAMVAAGVFLVSRLYPLLSREERLLDGLLAVGLLSMAIGGAIALTRDELKQLLAYSTVAQYGYVATMLGLGGTYGAAGAAFYVIAHALAKSALFFTAGAVTEATGESRLSGLGGMWRDLPALAVGGGLAAASLAALPLTVGFFKDELFFAAALERADIFSVLAVAGAAMTFAYSWRFWAGVFLGPRRSTAGSIPLMLSLPVLTLGGLGVVFGIVVSPVAELAEAAGEVTLGGPISLHPAYHLDSRPENLMALAAYAAGVILILSRAAWWPAATWLARLGERVGPARQYQSGLVGLDRFSDRIHRTEVRDLRSKVAAVLAPTALLVGTAFVATFAFGDFDIGRLRWSDMPIILVLALAAAAAVATTVPRDHLATALVLSGVGFSLAVFYAFNGAPNVALVAVLVETIFAVLFLGMLALLPPSVAKFAVSSRGFSSTRRWRDPALGVIAGLFAFVVAWSVLSRPAARESVSAEQTVLTPAAHAKDVVTAILADFRGFDTLGEVTVLLIAMVGLASLLRRGLLR